MFIFSVHLQNNTGIISKEISSDKKQFLSCNKQTNKSSSVSFSLSAGKNKHKKTQTNSRVGAENGKLLKTFTKEIKIHQKLKKHFNCCEKDKKNEEKPV